MNRRVIVVWTFLCSLLVSLPSDAAPPPRNPWAILLERDLQAMHRVLVENHPGAVDPLNKDFAQWLQAGYRQALDRAKRCDSYEGYRFALEAYAFGFKDGHLGVDTELRREDVRWPGFLIGWQPDGSPEGGKAVVRVTDPTRSEEGPSVGSELVSCDGKTPRQLLERDVFPFSITPELEVGWMEAAPMLFVDEANPWRGQMPRTCEFREKGVARTQVLRWRPIDYTTYRTNRNVARERPKLDFVIRPFGERGVWVGLPSFSVSRESAIAALEAAIARAPSWRDRDPIVFDVRTNGGGSSIWGKQLLEALYGKELVTSLRQTLSAKQHVEWRVSRDNYDHVNTTIAAAVRRMGPEEAKRIDALATGFARALGEGKSLWREPAPQPAPFTGPAPGNPVAGRVFLLTDGGCGSACLDFADLVRALPGAQHVGRTTAADSVYMELRFVPLPSGIARLGFATKVYRNRARGHNQPYVPHHIWNGNITDTAALERWIMSLRGARQ
jgi:hypothetical protein